MANDRREYTRRRVAAYERVERRQRHAAIVTLLAPVSPGRADDAYPLIDGALALARQVEAPPDRRAVSVVATADRQETQGVAADQHILIVEDDSRIADVIRNALELEGEPGWAVHVAREGRLALDVAGSTPPQVVLLDVGLPGLDGAEVYRRLRANPRTQDARVLFLTAATSLDLHQQGIEGGVLMRKPFDIQEVVSLVRALLVR